MADLINSLKIFTSNAGGFNDGVKTNARNVPLISIGQADNSSDSGFNQWRDAMRMVARLPGGLPPEFRIRLWENLADQYLQHRGLDWARVVAKCKAFENSRDEEIADQIQKDLHRTGCTGFTGAEQAVLKRVLVAYAKWNPSVGYCQGFNMIGAMLLQMTGEDELLTLKIFVFLIEGILPQGYFSQGLRGLAIDMAVFREILKLRKPTLHAHLSQLQRGDDNPPLTDVFTMHWFLTLFIHCLPTPSVLRIWDLVLLEGSEVLLRTALVLWAAIETRILCVTSADDFYSVMGVVTREMLEFGLMDPNSLVKCIVSVGQFPFPGLEELRRKHKLLIAQDTPHKSFFLAKRELDNLKRHYASIRQRQRSSSIIHNLESFHKKASNSSTKPPVTPVKKTVVASPKPKPRRTNSANKNVIGKNVSRSNSLNKSTKAAGARAHSTNNNSNSNSSQAGGTGNDHRKQVTVPWNMIKKKPKNRPKRATSSASNCTSTGSSSSSSTELCDSSTSEEENNGDPDSVWADAPTCTVQPLLLDSAQNQCNTTDCTDDTSKKVTLDKPKNSIANKDTTSANNDTTKSSSPKSLPNKIIPQSMPKSPDRPEKLAFQIPEINLINTQMNLTVKLGGDSLEMQPEFPTEIDLGGVVDMEANTSSRQTIDTNDSQHFLEEMSRLGKSDSFYENLSHRICQLQFQNLRILTTCNTIPDPVIMPPVEFSPLPSPMSPLPKSPGLPSTPVNIKNTLGPHLNARLILSPSLNHLSLSTSPRGSVSGPPSQPGSPQVRSPTVHSRSDFSDVSRTSSRRTSKSSISSIEHDDKSFDSPIAPVGGILIKNDDGKVNSEDCKVISEDPALPLDSSNVPLRGDNNVIAETCRGDSLLLLAANPGEGALKLNSETYSDSEKSEEVAKGKEQVKEKVKKQERVEEQERSNSPDTTTSQLPADAEFEDDGGDAIQPVEDISAVIRENIAILQRLKLKPAFDDDFDDGWSTSSFSECSDMESPRPGHAQVTESNKRSNTTPRRPIRCNSSSGSSMSITDAGRSFSLSRTNSTGSNSSKNTTATSASGTTTATAGRKTTSNKSKPKKIIFNPFPTSRKARVRTAKFGLYS